jgi:hypothetical protein
MAKAVRAVSDAATTAHRAMKEFADRVGAVLVDAFQLPALFVIGATTIRSAAAMFLDTAADGRARIEDILLLFIYLEIGATEKRDSIMAPGMRSRTDFPSLQHLQQRDK